jgi:pimeloyl-ACP methyl ester carboxylesterase
MAQVWARTQRHPHAHITTHTRTHPRTTRRTHLRTRSARAVAEVRALGVWQRTVVCVHGLTRNSHDFDALAARLTHGPARCRMLCLDLIGRGRSDPLAPGSTGTYGYPLYVDHVLQWLVHTRSQTHARTDECPYTRADTHRQAHAQGTDARTHTHARLLLSLAYEYIRVPLCA